MKKKILLAIINFGSRFSSRFRSIRDTIKAYEEVCILLQESKHLVFGQAGIQFLEKDLKTFKDAFKTMDCPYPGDAEFYKLYKSLLATGRNWIGCSFMCVSITNREIMLYSIAKIQGRSHNFNFNL